MEELTPRTRIEYFLNKIAEARGGGGGGGGGGEYIHEQDVIFYQNPAAEFPDTDTCMLPIPISEELGALLPGWPVDMEQAMITGELPVYDFEVTINGETKTVSTWPDGPVEALYPEFVEFSDCYFALSYFIAAMMGGTGLVAIAVKDYDYSDPEAFPFVPLDGPIDLTITYPATTVDEDFREAVEMVINENPPSAGPLVVHVSYDYLMERMTTDTSLEAILAAIDNDRPVECWDTYEDAHGRSVTVYTLAYTGYNELSGTRDVTFMRTSFGSEAAYFESLTFYLHNGVTKITNDSLTITPPLN